MISPSTRGARIVAGLLSGALLGGCSISGGVTSGGSALEGVTVKVEGPAQRTDTTGSDGTYSFTSLLAMGTYTVTPSKPGHEMTPVSRQVLIDDYFERARNINFAARKLDPVVAPVLGNVTATDLQNDGTFDNINAASPVEVHALMYSYLNKPSTKRAIFEFDLSSVSRTVPVGSAVLQFSVVGWGGAASGVQLAFWGYRGDGTLNLADAVAGDTLVGTVQIASFGTYQIDITTFVQQLMSTGAVAAGLNVRIHNEATGTFGQHCLIEGIPAATTTYPAPRLTIAY